MYNENLRDYSCNLKTNTSTGKAEIEGTIKPYDESSYCIVSIQRLLENAEMNRVYSNMCKVNPEWVERAEKEDVKVIVNYAKPSVIPHKLSLRLSFVGPGKGEPTISFDNYTIL